MNPPLASGLARFLHHGGIHEAHRFCGFGAELAATIQEAAFHDLDAPVHRVAALDAPIPYSRNLERAVLPQVDGVVDAARRVLGQDR